MGEQITFWYGCNVLRHGDIIHSCLDILRLLGMDAQAAGGPDYCCGTAKDDNQTAADGMARRTVTKFNAIGRERVVAWCPSCHSHMTEFMGQAYKPEFGLSYLVDVLYEKRAALSALLKHPVPMRVLCAVTNVESTSALSRAAPATLSVAAIRALRYLKSSGIPSARLTE